MHGYWPAIHTQPPDPLPASSKGFSNISDGRRDVGAEKTGRRPPYCSSVTPLEIPRNPYLPISFAALPPRFPAPAQIFSAIAGRRSLDCSALCQTLQPPLCFRVSLHA